MANSLNELCLSKTGEDIIGGKSGQGHKNLFFRYTLSYDEAFESFFLLAAKGTERSRSIVAVALLLLATVLTILYAFYPFQIEYCFLAFLSLITFGGVVYYPRFKAHKGAKGIEKTAGTYQVQLRPQSGDLVLPDGQSLSVAGDKEARAFETETLFVIRPDRLNTFCLPKRVMNQAQIEAVQNFLKEYMKNFTIKGGQNA